MSSEALHRPHLRHNGPHIRHKHPSWSSGSVEGCCTHKCSSFLLQTHAACAQHVLSTLNLNARFIILSPHLTGGPHQLSFYAKPLKSPSSVHLHTSLCKKPVNTFAGHPWPQAVIKMPDEATEQACSRPIWSNFKLDGNNSCRKTMRH